MTGSVLVVGDANVDLVLRGDIVPRFGQAEQLLEDAALAPGGSAGITANGLARLGVPTGLVAVVGDDDFGLFTRNALQANGVETAALATASGVPTGVSVILSTLEDRAILTRPGSVSLIGPTEVRTALHRFAPDHVHFSSYFLLPRLAAELPALLSQLRAAGITSSIDTNWDPATRWTGLGAVLPLVDLVLPNLEELRAICSTVVGRRESDEDAALALAELGPAVVVKAGAEGGWSVTASGIHHRPAPSADAVDTTGAGDSFNAGYLAAVAHGVVEEEARLHWAVVAGTLSTRSAGGTAAQPSLTELFENLFS
ncbi:carbohydrate kinase family protein [Leifsonella bigeumensis]|uniref:carbohydrate kinase family protein n=1 Tax=Leifsonella bigeumensis TaxID=433643 RepID=UPI0031D52909